MSASEPADTRAIIAAHRSAGGDEGRLCEVPRAGATRCTARSGMQPSAIACQYFGKCTYPSISRFVPTRPDRRPPRLVQVRCLKIQKNSKKFFALSSKWHPARRRHRGAARLAPAGRWKRAYRPRSLEDALRGATRSALLLLEARNRARVRRAAAAALAAAKDRLNMPRESTLRSPPLPHNA